MFTYSLFLPSIFWAYAFHHLLHQPTAATMQWAANAARFVHSRFDQPDAIPTGLYALPYRFVRHHQRRSWAPWVGVSLRG